MQFKLQDMHDKEDQKDKISIQLSCTNLIFSILQFFKYSHYAQEKYFSNSIINEISEEIQNIDKKYHFSKKSLETFIRLIEDEETIICNEDYFDLYKLSEIFQIHPLQKILQKYAKNNSNEIDFIINLIKHKETTNDELFYTDTILVNGEEILQDKIEECLLNKQFKELPISIIYRIIEKSKLGLNSSNLLSNQLKNDVLCFISLMLKIYLNQNLMNCTKIIKQKKKMELHIIINIYQMI